VYDSPNASQNFPFLQQHGRNSSGKRSYLYDTLYVARLSCGENYYSQDDLHEEQKISLFKTYIDDDIIVQRNVRGPPTSYTWSSRKKLTRSDCVPFESIRFLHEPLFHTANGFPASNLRVLFVLRRSVYISPHSLPSNHPAVSCRTIYHQTASIHEHPSSCSRYPSLEYVNRVASRYNSSI
jgi:hypothetical protein